MSVITAEREMTKKTHQLPHQYKQTNIIYCLWCQNKFPPQFPFAHFTDSRTMLTLFPEEEKMKVGIWHTRHWDLENKLARGVDGYPQFTCPLERIQSMKRGLSRLQNLLYCSQEMKVLDHNPLLEIFASSFQSSAAFTPSNSLEPLWIEECQRPVS